jgi:hypothetical protein
MVTNYLKRGQRIHVNNVSPLFPELMREFEVGLYHITRQSVVCIQRTGSF